MTNGGIIEGGSTLRVGFSDLSPTTSFCQSIPKTPMNVGERWGTIGWAAKLPNGSMRVFHGAGTTDEENAGRYSKTDERHIGRQRFGLSLRTVGATSWSGEGYGLLVVSAPDNTAPHYPRNHGNPYIEKGMHTRPQLHFTFGGGDCSFANASEGFKGWGADEVASPRS